MKVNRFKMFLKLFEKEIIELKLEILLTIFAVAVASILVYINGPQIRWTTLLFIMVAGLAGLLPVISAGKIFTKEFSHNTIYLVMSLPVRGGLILGSKLAAVVIQYLIGTITVMISATLLAYVLFPAEIAIIIQEINGIPWGLGFSIYLLTIAFGIYLVTLIFFSQIIGKLVVKFQGLITAITLVGTLWITNKLFSSLTWHKYFSQMPGLPPVEPILYTSLFYMGVALLVFITAVLIYNHRIEL